MGWELLQSNQSSIHYLLNPKLIQPMIHVKQVVFSPKSIWVKSKPFNPFQPSPLPEWGGGSNPRTTPDLQEGRAKMVLLKKEVRSKKKVGSSNLWTQVLYENFVKPMIEGVFSFLWKYKNQEHRNDEIKNVKFSLVCLVLSKRLKF